MSDVMTESNSAAARFLNEHEDLQRAHAIALAKIDDQENELIAAHNKLDLQAGMIKNLQAGQRLYQQYAITLATHIDVAASGMVNALKISASIREQIDNGANIPKPDVAALEALLPRLKSNFGDGPGQERKGQNPLSIGDRVRLKSGGPIMTIVELAYRGYMCSYTDQFGVLTTQQFPEATVERVETVADAIAADASEPHENDTPEAQSLLASVGEAIGLGEPAADADGPAPEPRFNDTDITTIDRPFLNTRPPRNTGL